jgi:hypothetical protein
LNKYGHKSISGCIFAIFPVFFNKLAIFFAKKRHRKLKPLVAVKTGWKWVFLPVLIFQSLPESVAKFFRLFLKTGALSQNFRNCNIFLYFEQKCTNINSHTFLKTSMAVGAGARAPILETIPHPPTPEFKPSIHRT